MKKAYTSPIIEFETYSLSDSIAANCGTVISAGPGDYSGKVCSEFGDSWEMFSIRGASTYSNDNPFYDGVIGPICDCVYTSGGEGIFTS